MKKVFKAVSFNNVMFRRKMIIIYLVGIFLPMIIIGGFYCGAIIKRVRTANIREIEFDTETAASAVERVIDKARMISDEIYYDTSLNRCLMTDSGGINDFFKIDSEINGLRRYMVGYDFVENIEIYTYNDKLYRNQLLVKMSEMPEDAVWYDKFLSLETDYAVISYADNKLDKSFLSIVRRLDNYSKCNDILKVDISYAALTNELIYNREKGVFCLFNEDNICIATSKGETTAEYLGCTYEQINTNEIVVESKLTLPVDYIVYCKYENNYIANVGTDIFWFILLMIAVLAASYVMVYITSYSMIKKMNELTDATGKMQKGSFIKISEEDIGNDEIGSLTRGFNAAVDKINMLINEVYRVKLRNAEVENERSRAEFIALQRQINPHFLFNIFEILRMKCVKSGNDDIAGIIKNLSLMMRQQISWKKDIITFEEERMFINAFIELCRCNFDNDITVNISVDDKVNKCLVPKMAIQVFVENAFRHGLDSIAQNRVFELSARASGDKFVIRVSDNGKGIDKQLVDAINSGDIEYIKAMSGDGLSNVFARLGLYFDNEFKIAVSSVPFEKTEFCIELPCKLYDKEWSE